MAQETKSSKKRVARKVTLSKYMVSEKQRREGEGLQVEVAGLTRP